MKSMSTWIKAKRVLCAFLGAGMPLAVTASCDPGGLSLFAFDDDDDFVEVVVEDDCFFDDCYDEEVIIIEEY